MGGKKDDGSKKAAREMKRSRKALGRVALPDIASMTIDPEEKKLLEELKLAEMGPSAMESISLDPKFRDAQMDALAGMQERGRKGFDDTDLAMLRMGRRGEDARAKSQQDTILSQMDQRGVLDSGASIQAQLGAAQASAQRGAEATDRQAIASAQARTSAAAQAANLAGGMESADFGRQSQVAGASDRINQFNVGLQNQANIRNVEGRQRIAEGNIDTRNRADLYNKQLQQQDFENRYRRAGGQAAASTNLANIYANQQSGPSKGQSAMAGAATGAAVGNVVPGVGTAIGAGVGGAAGYFMAEDGGIADDRPRYFNGGTVDPFSQEATLTDQINAGAQNIIPKGTQQDAPYYLARPSEPIQEPVSTEIPKEIPKEVSRIGEYEDPLNNIRKELSGMRGPGKLSMQDKQKKMSLQGDANAITEGREAMDAYAKEQDTQEVAVDDKTPTPPSEDKPMTDKEKGSAIASGLGAVSKMMGSGSAPRKELKLDAGGYYTPSAFKMSSPYEDGGLTGEQRIKAMLSRDASPSEDEYQDGGVAGRKVASIKRTQDFEKRLDDIREAAKARESVSAKPSALKGSSIDLDEMTKSHARVNADVEESKRLIKELREKASSVEATPPSKSARVNALKNVAGDIDLGKGGKSLGKKIGGKIARSIPGIGALAGIAMAGSPSEAEASVTGVESMGSDIMESPRGMAALSDVQRGIAERRRGMGMSEDDIQQRFALDAARESQGLQDGGMLEEDLIGESGATITDQELERLRDERLIGESGATIINPELKRLRQEAIEGYNDGGLYDPSPYDRINMEEGGTYRMEDGSLDFTSDGEGDIVGGDSFERDRVDARLNSGEAVLNVAQQQRLMDLINGKISPDEMGTDDIVEGVPADFQEELTEEIDSGESSNKAKGLSKLLDILGE